MRPSGLVPDCFQPCGSPQHLSPLSCFSGFALLPWAHALSLLMGMQTGLCSLATPSPARARNPLLLLEVCTPRPWAQIAVAFALPWPRSVEEGVVCLGCTEMCPKLVGGTCGLVMWFRPAPIAVSIGLQPLSIGFLVPEA